VCYVEERGVITVVTVVIASVVAGGVVFSDPNCGLAPKGDLDC